MNITTKISARILFLVQRGMPLPAAFDTILGVGSYAKLANDMHATLNTKQA